MGYGKLTLCGYLVLWYIMMELLLSDPPCGLCSLCRLDPRINRSRHRNKLRKELEPGHDVCLRKPDLGPGLVIRFASFGPFLPLLAYFFLSFLLFCPPCLRLSSWRTICCYSHQTFLSLSSIPFVSSSPRSCCPSLNLHCSLTLPQEVSCAEKGAHAGLLPAKERSGTHLFGPPSPPYSFCSHCRFLLRALCRWPRPADRISEGFWDTALQPWRERTAAVTSRPQLHFLLPSSSPFLQLSHRRPKYSWCMWRRWQLDSILISQGCILRCYSWSVSIFYSELILSNPTKKWDNLLFFGNHCSCGRPHCCMQTPSSR